MNQKPVILTAPRLSQELHIGNYLGALLPMIDLATSKGEEYQLNLFVADLHGITTPTDYENIQTRIFEYLRIFVAAGFPLDQSDTYIYRQSYIPAHSELAWILDCFTGFGEMNRMTQFKDKSSKLSDDRISVGLFNYPVLMAADILLYNATYVPVGDDQTQHLEFTRDIAERMNKQFNTELFTVPKPVKEQHQFFGKDQGLRIMDLTDPTKKMSKSDETGKGVIFLTDTPEQARKKVMSATTDSVGQINYTSEQPGIKNLIEIAALLKGVEPLEVARQFEGQTQYGAFKSEVADIVADFLTSFKEKYDHVDDSQLLAHLEASEVALREQANHTLYKVQKAVGLRA